MDDHGHQYDLAFVSPNGTRNALPEIVFIIHKMHLPETQERLRFLTCRMEERAAQYCRDDEVVFTLPESDLFGNTEFDNTEFGYGSCGRYTEEGETISFRIQLDSGVRTYYAALTLHVLLATLEATFETRSPSNLIQQTCMSTRADNDSSDGWGHLVNGWVSSSVISWLIQYYDSERSVEKKAGSDTWVLMHPEVIQAMHEACQALWGDGETDFARYITGGVRSQGRFTLECIGDRCDLGISERPHVGDAVTNFGCHNLDSAVQQLTLLAGLAKICELARK